MSVPGVQAYSVPAPDDEELLLTKLVFGDTADFHGNLSQLRSLGDEFGGDEDVEMMEANSAEEDGEAENEQDEMNAIEDDQLFYVDDGTAADEQDNNTTKIGSTDDSASDSGHESEYDSSSGDAWSDSDDERVEVAFTTTNKTKKLRTSYSENHIKGKEFVSRLRSQFEKIYPRPRWADSKDDEENSGSDDAGSDEEGHEQVINGDLSALSRILQSTYSYKDTSSRLLPPKTLDITRLKDANAVHPSRAAIQSLAFHPLKPLLLTGGYDRTLRVYHIDGKNNHLVSS